MGKKITFKDFPASGPLSPFEKKADPYFVYMTGGGRVSMSCPKRNFTLEEISHFPMGYTQLWIMERVVLLTEKGRKFTFKEQSGVENKGKVGRYYIVADELQRNHRPMPSDANTSGFETIPQAWNHIQGNKISGNVIIARLLEDIYWH